MPPLRVLSVILLLSQALSLASAQQIAGPGVCTTLDNQLASFRSQCPTADEVAADIATNCNNIGVTGSIQCSKNTALCDTVCGRSDQATMIDCSICENLFENCVNPILAQRCQCAIDKWQACSDENERRCLIATTVNDACTELGYVSEAFGAICPFQVGSVRTVISGLAAFVGPVVTAFTTDPPVGQNRDLQLSIMSALIPLFVSAGIAAQQLVAFVSAPTVFQGILDVAALKDELASMFGKSFAELCLLDLAVGLATTACGLAVTHYNEVHHCPSFRMMMPRSTIPDPRSHLSRSLNPGLVRRSTNPCSDVLSVIGPDFCNFVASDATNACQATNTNEPFFADDGLDVSTINEACQNLDDVNTLFPLLCNLRTALLAYEPFCAADGPTPSSRARRQLQLKQKRNEEQHKDLW